MASSPYKIDRTCYHQYQKEDEDGKWHCMICGKIALVTARKTEWEEPITILKVNSNEEEEVQGW